MHQKLIDRLSKEFGEPESTFRWTIRPKAAGRAAITVQVDGDAADHCTSIKVWVFNPGKGPMEPVCHVISCDDDVEGLIARIVADLAESA